MDEDDIGELPPQFKWKSLPTQSSYQLPTQQNLARLDTATGAGEGRSQGDGNDARSNNGGAADAPALDVKIAPAVVRKPIPKLNADRLLDKNIGILALHKSRKKLIFKGKGHEASDLKRLMQMYDQWAHKCFGKFTITDFALRTEKVCETKRMKQHLERWRRDPENLTFLSDELIEADKEDDADTGAEPLASNGDNGRAPNASDILINTDDDPFEQLDRIQPIAGMAFDSLDSQENDVLERRRAEARARLAERKRQQSATLPMDVDTNMSSSLDDNDDARHQPSALSQSVSLGAGLMDFDDSSIQKPASDDALDDIEKDPSREIDDDTQAFDTSRSNDLDDSEQPSSLSLSQ